METFVKNMLEKQMQILSERSTTAAAGSLVAYTEQIINLAKVLDPELRSQSYAEELSRLPSATLTMSDLEEITAARKEKLRRAGKEFYRLLDECRKVTPSPPPESDDTIEARAIKTKEALDKYFLLDKLNQGTPSQKID